MPKSYAPLQVIAISADNLNMVSSVALSMLLPTLSDNDAFYEAFGSLFGYAKMTTQRNLLKEELESFTLDIMPASLPLLINDYLQPKLSAYCHRYALDQLDHNALAVILQIPIECHDNTDISLARMPLKVYPAQEGAIHLLVSDGHVLPLVDPESLSFVMRSRLFPIAEKQVVCLAFEGMLRRGFKDTATKFKD